MVLKKTIFIAILILISLSFAHADTFIVTDDSTVSEVNPTTNYGTSGTLYVETKTNANWRNYYQFYVNSTQSLASAYVKLHNTGATAWLAGLTVDFYYCDDSFAEGTINWNNQNTEVLNCDAQPIANLTSSQIIAGTFVSIDVTSKADADADGNFIIKAKTNIESYDGTDRYYSFQSSESANASQKPYSEWTLGAPQANIDLQTSLVNNTKVKELTFPFYFNASLIEYTADTFNCSLYIDSVLNLTEENLNLSVNQDLVFPASYYQGEHELNVTCRNSNATDSIRRSVFVDTVQPIISIGDFNENKTYYSDTDYYLNVTFEDDNLAGAEINISQNITGSLTLKYRFVNFSLTGNTSWTLEQLTNSSSWCTNEPCQYWVSYLAYDDHNPVAAPHETVKILPVLVDNSVAVEFHAGSIFFEDINLVKYQLVEENNKYVEIYELKLNSGTRVIRSTSPMQIRQTNHKGHIIIPGLRKYIDFDSEDLEITEMLQVSDREIHVSYRALTKDVKTESIGDLNVNVAYQHFTIEERPDLNTQALLDIKAELVTLNSTNTQILGVIELLPMVLLWAFLWAFGFYTMRQNNELLAGTMIVLTIPLDIYLAYKFQETLMVGTGFIGIAMGIMAAWTFGVFLLIKRKTSPIKS